MPKFAQRMMLVLSQFNFKTHPAKWAGMAVLGVLATVVAIYNSGIIRFGSGILAVGLLGYTFVTCFAPLYAKVCEHFLSYTSGQLRFMGLAELSISAAVAALFWYVLAN